MNNFEYKTTFSKKAKFNLIRNTIIYAICSTAFYFYWYLENSILYFIVAIIMSILFLITFIILIKSSSPLQITSNEVIITSLFKNAIPLKNIKEIGLHPRNKKPSLSYSNPKEEWTGEISLPWKFIAETQDEVLEKLQLAIDTKNTKSNNQLYKEGVQPTSG